MDDYTNSVTWRKTLGLNSEDKSIREYISDLKNSYMNIRRKAIYLANEIGRFLPNYTVHDISHIDALWDATDIILPEEYELNPVEGYVLGVAFLIHDLGMGLVAYANDEEQIKKFNIWKDTVAVEFKKRHGKEIGEKDWKYLEPEIKNLAQENTLRKLHAEQASKLPTLEWKFDDKREYLIDNTILREAYGEIIGLIAYSHWWNIDKVKKEFQNKYLGALSIYPSNWTVDVIKLACILRIADAIQIDDRRAPIFLMKLRKPKEVSKVHWIFQNKLYQPLTKNGKINYTSKSSFSIDEIEAWWICYDALKMIDKELKSVDTLLVETGHRQFTVTGVGGISSSKQLSNYVRVNGWIPVDTSIRVGNVAKLVSNLGGTQLYGDNSLVPLRELVQNGSDAIRARKLLEDDEQYIGNIFISFYNEGNDSVIQIDDNGIGMSQNVLMGPFLDFGQSFWNTELMYDELPGLSSKGFSSTGKYGIGFYSIFMWSYDVTVITKRYDAAREDTLVLEFKNGTDSRPILRKAQKEEQIKDGGTRIKVRTKKDISKKIQQVNRVEESIDNSIAKLCPCLDCDLWINDGEKRLIEAANDWLTIAPIKFIKRLIGPNNYMKKNQDERNLIELMAGNMQIIQKDDCIYGRAMIYKEYFHEYSGSNGYVTLGGFSTTPLSGVLGVLIGKSVQASRESCEPVIKDEALKSWVNNQLSQIVAMGLDKKRQIDFATVICAFGIKPFSLCIAENYKGYLTYNDIYNLVRESGDTEYILVQDAAISIGTGDLPAGVKVDFNNNVLWCSTGYLSILQSRNFTMWPLWPLKNREEFDESGIKNIVIDAILDAWEINRLESNKHILESTDDANYYAVIGKIAGEEWKMDHITKVYREKIIK